MLHKAFTALFFVCIGSAKTRKKQDSPVFEKIKLITRKETTTMKLRTFTALLLAAIMLFALTACGSQAADDSSSDSIFSFAVMFLTSIRQSHITLYESNV